MPLVSYVCPACEETIGAGPSLEGTSAACPGCAATIKRWPAPKQTEKPLSLDGPSWTDRAKDAWSGGDRWAWAIVLVPLAGGILEWLVGATLLLPMLVANTVCAAVDTKRLREAGHRVPSALLLWGVFLVPVYLWKRSPLSRNGMLIFGSWFASVAVSFALSWQVYQRVELEDAARPLVTQIIKDNGGSARCTRVEITNNSGDGYYRAIASLDNGRYVNITIQKTRSMVYVEMPRNW